MKKVAINGFGRIGRPAFRALLKKKDIEVVAINDLTDTKTLAHLLKYDSVYRVYDKPVQFKEDALLVGDQHIKVTAEPDPTGLPWSEMGIDVVLECTGRFVTYEGAHKHIEAGAKKVIISAPYKGETSVPTFVLGVNTKNYDGKNHDVLSMASCTTNCLAPVSKVLNQEFGVVKGFMSTIHSYTSSQRLLDLPDKDLRRARAAALNVIPTTTGAAKAISDVIPELKGKLDGMAYRVPTPTVSIIDLTCELEKEASSEDINYAFKKASQTEELNGILGVEDAPLVSSDYIGNSFSAVVDALSTRAIGNMVKVLAWYDNEYGYSHRLADFAEFVAKKL